MSGELLNERVLIRAPRGRDADLIAGQLQQRGLTTAICRDTDALCEAIEQGAGVVFVAEEALVGDALECLLEELRRQPAWSDLPLIIMTEEGDTSAYSRRVERVLQASGNVTLLERPIRLLTLFSVVNSALKSRGRQYEVKHLLEDSRRAVEQRYQFLAMLGHELRNPLAAVVSAVGILRRFGFADADLAAEQRDVIARQSAHMARLVDDLLDVARITAGKVRLSMETVDLRDIAAKALQALQLMTGAQRHEITFDSTAESVAVQGDAVRLEQVVVNLLTNAVKYTPDGGRIALSVSDGSEAVLRVRDTGEGIPPEVIGSIFEPFTQVAQTLARSRGGLGMGLAVVKKLVEMHGGQVVVQSEGPGKGTEFTVRLPIAADTGKRARKAPSTPDEHPCRILLVEDNADARRALSRLLQMSGYQVETADDGLRGVERALEWRPEVVLMDIGLPGMDGYDAGRRIRSEFRETFLVALTGYGQPDDRLRVQQAGFDIHLVKPVDPDHLLGILARRDTMRAALEREAENSEQ